ncbi:MAG: pyridoxal-phosphate dependent enzyme [Ideonella sp.]|nr:pyridoxal-phosphate dependent enzyme [Ideonella sp.]
MTEVLDFALDTPTSWAPLPPTTAQVANLTRFALHADDLSLTVRAWRALAKDSALLLPYVAPYPGYLASPLRSLEGHPLQALLPDALPQAWIKCDNELPLSQSLSDRGMAYAVLSLVGDAMLAAGMAHMGQPLMGIDKPATRAWLAEHQLVIHGTGRDALAAARIARALGLPTQVILKGPTPVALSEALQDCGVSPSASMNEAAVAAYRRQCVAPQSSTWWLDSTESFEAFQGYACAAQELKLQLFSHDQEPSARQPLWVFVGSSNCLGAAALLRGLKGVFGHSVQTALVEDSQHLQALPTLCRWPKDGTAAATSMMGTQALLGVVDSVITVDARQRKLARLPLPEHSQAQWSDETIALFAAAAEHLNTLPEMPPRVVFWLSDCALA